MLTAPAPLSDEAPLSTPRYSLQEASNNGLVQYEVRGNGSSSGPSLVIGIRLTNFRAIDVYVLPGTVFTSGNANAQRMVAWRVVATIAQSGQDLSPVTSMYLPDAEERLFVIEAYCLDFHLDNPEVADAFTAQASLATPVEASLDIRAAQIIAEGKKRELTIEGIQSAIWMDHESVTQPEIKAKFDAAAKDLDDAFNMLQTLPPPQSLGAGRQTVKCK
jgi:hypothetical protein